VGNKHSHSVLYGGYTAPLFGMGKAAAPSTPLKSASDHQGRPGDVNLDPFVGVELQCVTDCPITRYRVTDVNLHTHTHLHTYTVYRQWRARESSHVT